MISKLCFAPALESGGSEEDGCFSGAWKVHVSFVFKRQSLTLFGVLSFVRPRRFVAEKFFLVVTP